MTKSPQLSLTTNGLPPDWPAYSCPNPNDLPRQLLTTKEILFVGTLMPNDYGSYQPIYDKEGLVTLLREHWGPLWENLSDETLLINLTSGEKYCDREYYEKDRLICSIRLFRKGLLQKFPMPKKGVRFEYWYGYPRERYRLGKKNFAAKYPPHDAFGGWCVKRLREGITGSINQLPKDYRKLAHFDGSGDYVADQSYRVTIDGKKSYWWVEIHTGSEGYGWEKFLKRIITAEQRLKDRGKFLVIVPFKREKEKAHRAIKKYNESEGREGPRIEQKVSQIIAYEEIDDWKEQEGLYEHKKRV